MCVVCVYVCVCTCSAYCLCQHVLYCAIFAIIRAPITKEHFRQYRVLGKGGFGLVMPITQTHDHAIYVIHFLKIVIQSL